MSFIIEVLSMFYDCNIELNKLNEMYNSDKFYVNLQPTT